MKKMTTTMIAMFSILSACAVDEGDEGDEGDLSYEESEATAAVVCTTGTGAGNCTAATMPTSWTIQQGSGGATIGAGGLTVGWSCWGTLPTRTVTAVGVGTATVKCSLRQPR